MTVDFQIVCVKRKYRTSAIRVLILDHQVRAAKSDMNYQALDSHEKSRRYIQEFGAKNAKQIDRQYREDGSAILNSLADPPLEKHSKHTACRRILNAVNALELQVASILKTRPAQEWLGILRYMPLDALPNYAIPICTIAAWKHGAESKPQGVERHGNRWYVLVEMSDEFLFQTIRVAEICRKMAALIYAHRRCGKGARVSIRSDGEVEWIGRGKIQKAMQFYDSRRPKDSLFFDVAQPIRIEDVGTHCVTIAAPLNDPVPLVSRESKQRIGELYRYFPLQISDRQLAIGMSLYGQEMAYAHGLSSEEFVLVLRALGSLCSCSFPKLFELNEAIGVDESETECIEFLETLCARGAIWFPRPAIEESLVGWISSHGHHSDTEAVRIVRTFLDAFKLHDNKDIDLSRLDPYPFLVETPAKTVYVDFLAFGDFIRCLVEGARSVQQVAHGDRFRNFLATWIREELGEHIVVGLEEYIPTDTGIVRADLLLRCKRHELFVECKAFAKSRDYWLGVPGAIAERTGRLRTVVTENEVRVKSVNTARSGRVKWAICMPDAEFVFPIGKFGWLVKKELPRIITPEELIDYLRRNA